MFVKRPLLQSNELMQRCMLSSGKSLQPQLGKPCLFVWVKHFNDHISAASIDNVVVTSQSTQEDVFHISFRVFKQQGSWLGDAGQKGARQSRDASRPGGAVSIGVTWAGWAMVEELPWGITPTQGDSSAPTSPRPCSMSGPRQHFIESQNHEGWKDL